MEIKYNKSYNLKLYVFLFHPASIFSQENPQPLVSPLGRSVCSTLPHIQQVRGSCVFGWCLLVLIWLYLDSLLQKD